MMIGWFWAGLLTGLAANECCAISEWTARKLVRWSAHVRYEDTERAEIRAQELEAVIADRPGQLFKLFTALCFVFAAMQAQMRRRGGAGLSVQVDTQGAATFRAITIGATVMFIAASVAIQIFLGPSLPQNSTGLPSTANRPIQARQGQLQVEQNQLATLQARVQQAFVAMNSSYEAWQCEVSGQRCGGSSGLVGTGPLGNAKRVAYDQARSTYESLEYQLLTTKQKIAALEEGSSDSVQRGNH
jgi:hypothetical protein